MEKKSQFSVFKKRKKERIMQTITAEIRTETRQPEHKAELREGRTVTRADPVGSEKALKADSRRSDEGSPVWRQRR